jgi:phage protein D
VAHTDHSRGASGNRRFAAGFINGEQNADHFIADIGHDWAVVAHALSACAEARAENCVGHPSEAEAAPEYVVRRGAAADARRVTSTTVTATAVAAADDAAAATLASLLRVFEALRQLYLRQVIGTFVDVLPLAPLG